MRNLNELFKDLEFKLNERDIYVKENDQLIKEIQGLEILLPELEQIINDLENKYKETNDVNVRDELVDYLKERELYWETIRELCSQVDSSYEDEVIRAFYKRKGILFDLHHMELSDEIFSTQEPTITVTNALGAPVTIFEKNKEVYQKNIQDLEVVEKEISDYYYLDDENMEFGDYSFDEEKNEKLERAKESLLNALQKLHISENKVLFDEPTVTIYNYVGSLVTILAKDEKIYKSYLKDIENIDRSLLNSYLEDDENVKESELVVLPSLIDFEEQKEVLERQQSSLLAELEKLEHSKGRKQTFKVSYQGVEKRVFIPKNLVGKYCAILSKLKAIEEQLAKVLPTVLFENELFETMTKEQKRAYLGNLMLQIEVRAQNSLNKCYVHGKYVPVEYKELYEDLIHRLKESSNKLISSNKFPINWKLVETFSLVERRDYFKGLMQQYLAVANKDVVELSYGASKYFVSPEDVSIFKNCYEEYIKASNELDMEQEKVDIQINETYVASLKDEEKISYYKNLLNLICSKEISNPILYTVDGQIYSFDEGYKEDFLNVVMHYDDVVNPKKYIVVEKKRKPKFLNKIKPKLKKYSVSIMIAASSLALLGGAYLAQKAHFDKKMVNIEKTIDNVQLVDDDVTINSSVDMEKIFDQANEIMNTSSELSNVVMDSLASQQRESLEGLRNFEDWTEAQGFQLNNENVAIFAGNVPFTPLYPNDEYRIVTRNYELPSGEIVSVNMESDEADITKAQVEEMGGVLKTVDAVAKSGEEDYALNKIPTGRFVIDNHLNPMNELDQEVVDFLNQNQGRGK